jgi:hypothetical protein
LERKIQNEIILAIERKIKERILEMLTFWKYYYVILAFTPDFSHQEQFTVIVRFVFLNENTRKIEIYENFLDSSSVDNFTSDSLNTYLVGFLAKDNIDTHAIRGQGCDNGANVKGKIMPCER